MGGGSVFWDAPLLSNIREEMELNSRRLVSYEKDDPQNNSQLSHHSPCSTYFDEESATFIRNGPESFIYDYFGYEGCCLRGRNQTNVSLSREYDNVPKSDNRTANS